MTGIGTIVRTHLGLDTPCPLLKKDAIEKFILDNLKEKVITRDIVRKGLEFIQAEETRNLCEDDSEQKEVHKQITQANLEKSRLEVAVKGGVHYEALADSINETHERIARLNKRLAEIEKEQEKALKLPEISEAMVNDMLQRVHAMLDITDRKELKVALTHFIERIEVHGQDVTIEYTFKKPSMVIVPTNGDPGGI